MPAPDLTEVVLTIVLLGNRANGSETPNADRFRREMQLELFGRVNAPLVCPGCS